MMMLFSEPPSEGGKRGRGTDKTKVLAGLSLNQKGHPLYLKMEVFPDVKGETIVEFSNRTIALGSIISSDAFKSYKALAEAELESININHKSLILPKIRIIFIGSILLFLTPKAFIAGTLSWIRS